MKLVRFVRISTPKHPKGEFYPIQMKRIFLQFPAVIWDHLPSVFLLAREFVPRICDVLSLFQSKSLLVNRWGRVQDSPCCEYVDRAKFDYIK